MASSRKLPRVLIDARMVQPQLHGVARYVTCLAEGLRRVQRTRGDLGYEPVFLVAPSMERSAYFEGFATHVEATPYLHGSEQWTLPRAIRAVAAALYHSPSFASLVHCPCPWIVTVHDLNHLTYGGWKEKLYYQMILKPFARRAKALLTVSEFSRSELAPWVGRTDIQVVSNAIDSKLAESLEVGRAGRQAILARMQLEEGRYFLSLSNPKPHKNIGTLVQAYTRYRANGGTWPLVLTLKEFSSVPGVVSLGAIPEVDAQALLRSAGALFFPSLYEGFGLPPVEAAVAGVRVVVSTIAAHREALIDLASSGEASEAGVAWVDPLDVAGWTEAFGRVERGELAAPRAAGKILARYAVDRLGDSMNSVYRRFL